MYVHPVFTPFTLVIAYLAGDPDFDKTSNELVNVDFYSAPESDVSHYKTECAKLLKYLREEVKPLV